MLLKVSRILPSLSCLLHFITALLSCQLLFNTFGWGCLGFRSLERGRSLYLAIHAMAIALLWLRKAGAARQSTGGCDCGSAPTSSRGDLAGRLASSFLLLALAFSEHGVRFINDRGGLRALLKAACSVSRRPVLVAPGTATHAGIAVAWPAAMKQDGPALKPAVVHLENATLCAEETEVVAMSREGETLELRVLRFNIAGMKCEGCRHGVLSALTAHKWVASAEVKLGGNNDAAAAASAGICGQEQRLLGGIASVTVTADAPDGSSLKLVEAVSRAGYTASLGDATEIGEEGGSASCPLDTVFLQ
ncbi:unnamed protein product [Phaeothamnion confervicola]